MTRETKFGLLLVLSLTTTFGFLVWKKMHQPKDLVATTESVGETPGDEDELVPGKASLSPDGVDPLAPPLADMTPERMPPRRPTTLSENTPRGEDLFAKDTPIAKPQPRTKPQLPVDLDAQDAFAAPVSTARAMPATESAAPAAEVDPFAAPASAPVAATEQPDPFADSAAPVITSSRSQPAATDFTDPAVETQTVQTFPAESVPVTTEPDPFSAEPVRETVTSRTVTAAPVVEADPLADVPASVPGGRDVEKDLVQDQEPPVITTPAPALAPGVSETPVEITARSTVPEVKAEITTVPEPVLNLPVNTEPPQLTNSQVVAAKEPDPFFVEEAVPARTPVKPAPAAPPRAAAPVIEPDPFGTPAAIPESPVRVAPAPTRTPSLSFDDPVPVRAAPIPVRAEPIPVRRNAPANAPHAFAGEAYIVQPNDNFWTISKKVYGTGRYFEALAHYNAGLVSDPSKMKPGLKIATPTEAELQSRYAKLLATTGTQVTANDPVSLGLPGDVYTAVSGDNFWEISKRLYGDGKYFRALEQHNAAIVADPQKLKPGMKLAAPKAAWLQAKYPQLIAHAAPAVQDLKRVQPSRYQPDEPAGFFIGVGEQPMYRVGSSDTLTDIAKNYLGRSSRWVQIYEMNRDVLTDGNALSVGTVLKLPADASRVAVIEPGVLRR